MRSKTLAILTIIALCLSLASVVAPPLASPAKASPMETINLILGVPTAVQLGNQRPINLQNGDEIIQFTRPNLIVGSNPTSILQTVSQQYGLVTGDLSGTISDEFHIVVVRWDGLPPTSGKGYGFGTIAFDDGHGNTFHGIKVADIEMADIEDSTHTGYVVSTSGTGAFANQLLIGTWSANSSGGTMTLRRYSSSEVSGPYPVTGTSSMTVVTPGNWRVMGTSTGPEPNDEFLQFSRDNIVTSKEASVLYMEGFSGNDSLTSSVFPNNVTVTNNQILIPGTTPQYQGLIMEKVTGSDASGNISGVLVMDNLGDSGGGTHPLNVYMFFLREKATGAYAGKDYYGEGTVTSSGDTGTRNINLYIMEPQAAGSTVSGTITVSDGTVSGTYSTSPPYETLTGTGTADFNLSGDISGTSTFTGTYDASDQLMHGTSVSAPCTLTIGGVTHTAMIYGKSTTTNFVVGPPGYPDTSPVTFDMLMSGSIWTTDGSNIFIYVTGSGSGNATESWPAPGQYQMTDFTVSGTWSGTAQNFETAPQVSDVTPGSGTVTLSGAQGTVAQLNYETTGSGTILLAQYTGNPGGTPVKTPLGKYVEVDTSIISPEITWPVQLRVYYTDAEVAAAGVDESSLRMYRWNGSNWVQVAESGANTSQNYVWANLYSFSPYGPMGNPLGGGGASSVPVFPSIYIGIAAALGAGVLAYLLRRRIVREV